MRYFSVQEANAFIPALEATFGYIEELCKQVTGLVAELRATGDLGSLEGDGVPEGTPEAAIPLRKQIAGVVVRIRRLVRELESHGLIVKQLDGLVDFRSKRGERPVRLCWRKGEDHIDHWHEAWSDDTSPQPVDRLFQKTLLN